MNNREMLEELKERIENEVWDIRRDILEEYSNDGCIEAMYLLGESYYYIGDFEQAKSYFEDAASQGYGQAKVKLGIIYETGVPFGVKEDFEKAWKLYLDAADNDDCADAQYEIGRHYFYGIQVEEDCKKAFEYFSKAAEKNKGEALKMLADCYRYGKNIEKNIEKALELLEMAYEEAVSRD